MSGTLMNGDAVENDPAAEFLAREQDELAGLGDDLGAVRMEDQAGFDDFELLSGSSSSGVPVAVKLEDDPFGMGGGGGGERDSPAFSSSAAPPPGKLEDEGGVTELGDDGIGVDVLDLNGEAGEDEGLSTHVLPNPESRSPTASPIPSSISGREEPEKIRKWREEQKVRLEQKDKDEEVQKGKLREQAKRELEEWYRSHEEQIGKTKACNRAAEKEYQAMTAEVVPGQEWERIAKLCEFNPKLTRASRDTSRMRSIILQLKQNPPTPTKTAAAAVVS